MNKAQISQSEDTPSEAVKRLSAAPAYRRMALVGAAGTVLLGLLGWAAFSRTPDLPPDAGYELLANTTGLIKDITVREGQEVHKGDLLLLLDDSAEQRALTVARTELDTLAQEAQSSNVAVAMPPGSGIGGQIVQIGPLPKGPPSERLGALPPVTETSRPASVPDDGIRQAAESNVRNLESKMEALQFQKIEVAQRRDDALNRAEEAQRNADASKVIADQRKKQSEKMQMLLAEGAVSRVEAARSESLYLSAQGGADAAQKMADEQRTAAGRHEAELVAIDSQMTQLTREIAAAKELVAKAPKDVAPSASLPVGKPVPEASIPNKPAFVRSTQAPNIPAKVEIDKGAKRDVDDRLAAAKLKVDEAEQLIEGRRLVAPRDGVIVKVLVKPGDSLRQGQSVLVIRFTESIQKASK